MSSEFLSKLGLSEDEVKKLAGLGASTPAALLALRRAAPDDFERLFGKSKASEITVRLEGLLRPEERDSLASAPQPRRYPLGANLGTPPTGLPQPKFDIAERDRLFRELQSLRQSSSLSPADKVRLAELESRLNALLEST